MLPPGVLTAVSSARRLRDGRRRRSLDAASSSRVFTVTCVGRRYGAHFWRPRCCKPRPEVGKSEAISRTHWSSLPAASMAD